MEPFQLAPTHLIILNNNVNSVNNKMTSSSSSKNNQKSLPQRQQLNYPELKELQQITTKIDYKETDPFDNPFYEQQNTLEKIDGLIWNELDASATMVNQNLWQIPPELTVNYASLVRKLDLSYNCLQTLSGIEYFNCLEELILDNNLLDDNIRFFYNPFMQILSINKNKLTDLECFLNEITLKLPGLTYLSMLGNTACPDQLSSSEHDDKDYNRYRSYVIYRMPQLRFLDSTPVKTTERIEAQNRGQYYRLIRLNSDSVVETNRTRHHLFALRDEEENANNNRQNTPLPHNNNTLPKGGYGKYKYRYSGKHSEGNRFIKNHEL